ncbi:MAG TPA: DUF2950 family protein, partial [Candidatus Binataceae bacterium]|nr:DUF2950 family protein [Candidatus Binataceae bacterium]
MSQSLPCNAPSLFRRTILSIALAGVLLIAVGRANSQSPNEKVYSSADAAAAALVSALQAGDYSAVSEIVGIKKIDLGSGDIIADKGDVAEFLKHYEQMHRFANGPDGKYYLIVGAENWPMPIPLAKSNAGWYFDGVYGAKELR